MPNSKIEIQKLAIDQILEVLRQTPEQWLFDWKRDLKHTSPEDKGELVKDISAVANGTSTSPGFLFYGVDPEQSEPIRGITLGFDDASMQQLVMSKVAPPIDFLYYEVTYGKRIVGVVHIPPSRSRPHIICKDIGKLREGQILIRSGSSTRGITRDDLFETFYGETSPYFSKVLRESGAEAANTAANAALLRELREGQAQSIAIFDDQVGLNSEPRK